MVYKLSINFQRKVIVDYRHLRRDELMELRMKVVSKIMLSDESCFFLRPADLQTRSLAGAYQPKMNESTMNLYAIETLHVVK